MQGGLLLTDSVPFSCCDILSPRPCIEVDVRDSSRHFAYDPSKDLTIYKAGCVDQLTASVNRTAIQPLGSILLALFILMVSRRVWYIIIIVVVVIIIVIIIIRWRALHRAHLDAIFVCIAVPRSLSLVMIRGD